MLTDEAGWEFSLFTARLLKQIEALPKKILRCQLVCFSSLVWIISGVFSSNPDNSSSYVLAKSAFQECLTFWFEGCPSPICTVSMKRAAGACWLSKVSLFEREDLNRGLPGYVRWLHICPDFIFLRSRLFMLNWSRTTCWFCRLQLWYFLSTRQENKSFKNSF